MLFKEKGKRYCIVEGRLYAILNSGTPDNAPSMAAVSGQQCENPDNFAIKVNSKKNDIRKLFLFNNTVISDSCGFVSGCINCRSLKFDF